MILKTCMKLSLKHYFLAFLASLCLLVHHIASFPTAPSALSQEHDTAQKVWQNGLLVHIYDWLQCYNHEGTAPIPNATIWKLMHDTYESVVEPTTPLPVHNEDTNKGYQVPIEIKHEEGDWGVYTKHEIEKGTVVWKSTYTVAFEEGSQFRSFVRQLPTEFACQVLDWAFPRYDGETPVVCVDLDHGSLTNICDEDEGCNLEFQMEHEDSGCELEMVASRTIPAGEELQIDHEFGEHEEAFIPLGLKMQSQIQNDDDDEYDDEDEYYYEEEF